MVGYVSQTLQVKWNADVFDNLMTVELKHQSCRDLWWGETSVFFGR